MRANLREKQASLKAAQDSLAYLNREFDRQQQLAARSVVSVAKLDEARHNLDNARQQVAINQHDIAALLADLGGDPRSATEQHPRYRQARAERDQAALDLRRTRGRGARQRHPRQLDAAARRLRHRRHAGLQPRRRPSGCGSRPTSRRPT